MTRTKQVKRYLRTIASFLVAFFLIRYLLDFSDLDLSEVWALVDGRYLLLALFFHGAGFTVASYRWYLLLWHIGVKLSFFKVFSLSLIGQFFNLFVPGGVGGDLIKMVYLRQEAKEAFPEALMTVLLDRILGLAGLLLIGLVALGINPTILTTSGPEMQAILTVVALAGVGFAFCAVLFLLWPYLGGVAQRLSGLINTFSEKVRAIILRIVKSLSLIRTSPMFVVSLLLLSMFGHFIATLAVATVGHGVGGVESVSFQEFLLATQLGNLVGAVPITPGGLGGRDLTLAYLLTLSGATPQRAGAISLGVTGLIVVWSIAGGLALLWERKRLPQEPGDVPK